MCVGLCGFILKALETVSWDCDHDTCMLVILMSIKYASQVFDKMSKQNIINKLLMLCYYNHAMFYFQCYRVLGVSNTQNLVVYLELQQLQNSLSDVTYSSTQLVTELSVFSQLIELIELSPVQSVSTISNNSVKPSTVQKSILCLFSWEQE